MRISYSIDYIQDFNFRLHIQTRVKLWPLIETASKIGVIKSAVGIFFRRIQWIFDLQNDFQFENLYLGLNL